MTEDERFERILVTRQSIWKYDAVEINTSDTEPIINWLLEHIGPSGWNMKSATYNQYLFKFDDENHKTLFALTWL